MKSSYPLGGEIVVLALLALLALLAVALAIIIFTRVKSARRRKALQHVMEEDRQSKQALVRYVMLNSQCSEETAYERIAIFVKKYVPLDDQGSIDTLLIYDRQRLLDRAQNVLSHEPDTIDKI